MNVVGIDLGGTNIAAGLVDEKGKILDRASCSTDSRRPAKEIAADMAMLVKRLAGADGLAGVGIGVPGFVYGDMVLRCVNLGWWDVDVNKMMHDEGIDCCVRVGNDANCAALGEYRFGSCRGTRNAVVLTLGTGVGGGIIIDGKLYIGSRGYAAEIGHIPFVFDGIECPCGAKGCLEQYCSATALIRMSNEAKSINGCTYGKITSTKQVMQAVKEGDAEITRAFKTYTRCLAAAVNGLINMFDPDVIALGGGLSNAGDALLVPVIDEVKKISCLKEEAFKVKIVTAINGNDAGILGAAALIDNV